MPTSRDAVYVAQPGERLASGLNVSLAASWRAPRMAHHVIHGQDTVIFAVHSAFKYVPVPVPVNGRRGSTTVPTSASTCTAHGVGSTARKIYRQVLALLKATVRAKAVYDPGW